MNFKHFRIKNFLISLMIACMYPVLAYVAAENNPLLPMINALTIVGIVFLIFGMVNSMIFHGDFDITEYVAKRAANKGNIKPFKAFKEDKKEKREDYFNYPLFTGFVMIAAAILLTVFVY